jgi:hypothetical protein
MTLYEMTEAQKQLYELMTSGEIDEEVYADTLEGIGIADKIEGYCVVKNELSGDLQKIESELERLNKKKKSIENNIKWLNLRLGACLLSMDTTKYNAGTYTVYRRETEQVIIDDLLKIPAEFLKTRVSETPNKPLIKESIKTGKEIAGAHLQTNQSITIK